MFLNSSFDIPENTFHDAEDGYNLRLSMHDMTGAPLQYSSWVQFDPANRRVYGLLVFIFKILIFSIFKIN